MAKNTLGDHGCHFSVACPSEAISIPRDAKRQHTDASRAPIPINGSGRRKVGSQVGCAPERGEAGIEKEVFEVRFRTKVMMPGFFSCGVEIVVVVRARAGSAVVTFSCSIVQCDSESATEDY